MVTGEIKDSGGPTLRASAARGVEIQGLSALGWLPARRQRPQEPTKLGAHISNWSPQLCLAAASSAKIDSSSQRPGNDRSSEDESEEFSVTFFTESEIIKW